MLAYAKTKVQISCAVNHQRLCFCHSDSTILLVLKFEIPCHLLWLHRLVCARLLTVGRNPRRLEFSHPGSCIYKSSSGLKEQDPVVQSIVSLTISLRHKFVKQISAKVTNTLLFFVEKM